MNHPLLARKNGNWYYRYDPVWGDKQGHLVTSIPMLNDQELEITRKFICYPTPGIIAEIKQYFFLREGEVFKRDAGANFREKHFATIKYMDRYEDRIEHKQMKVPPEYIKAVLQGKKPNISGLFGQRGNRLYRSDRTYWGLEFRGVLVGEIECCGLYLW